jgi:hypothetical protein
MPLSKNDNPENLKATEADGSPKEVTTLKAGDNSATNEVIDAGAGAPASMREAAEDLPERNDVQKAIKAAMLADDAGTEAKEKAKVVELSPDSPETPSGAALLATADIKDDVKRGEEYARIKSAVRHGYVPAEAEDLKAKK